MHTAGQCKQWRHTNFQRLSTACYYKIVNRPTMHIEAPGWIQQCWGWQWAKWASEAVKADGGRHKLLQPRLGPDWRPISTYLVFYLRTCLGGLGLFGRMDNGCTSPTATAKQGHSHLLAQAVYHHDFRQSGCTRRQGSFHETWLTSAICIQGYGHTPSIVHLFFFMTVEASPEP